MNGGRARIELEYDIGFDSSGKIHALDMGIYMLGGIVMGGSTVDVFSLSGMIDQVSTTLHLQGFPCLLPSSLPCPCLTAGGTPACLTVWTVSNSSIVQITFELLKGSAVFLFFHPVLSLHFSSTSLHQTYQRCLRCL